MSVAVEFPNYSHVILITVTLSHKKSHIFIPFDFLSDFVCKIADIYICCELCLKILIFLSTSPQIPAFII